MLNRAHFFTLLIVLLSGSVFSQVYAIDASLIKEGSNVYLSRCLHCHGDKGQGDGHLVGILKVKPADLTQLNQSGNVTKKILGAILGRHKTGEGENKMPLLKEVLSLEEVYALSEFVETLQK